MSDGIRITVELPPEVVEEITAEVLHRLQTAERPLPRWLYGAASAADYLGWPVTRVYRNLPRLPHSRDGRRLVFSTVELDRYLEASYEGPARFVSTRFRQ